MCGIAGIIGPGWNGPGLETLLDEVARRGPDDYGVWREPDVALGHRRLSIIGLAESGRNPMFNEDESLALVFNGEIFNYESLRRELRARGHVFRSQTDTEVILHLYEEEGTSLCRRLEGMYAFALWDRTQQLLFAARDPFGEKPFYYYVAHSGTGIAFASSATALARSGVAPARLDAEPLAHYLLFGACVGTRLPIAGVRALAPGTQLVFRRAHSGVELETHHSIDELAPGLCDPAELTWEDIVGAVRRRMIADVPTGVFLSGGIDSTAVAVAMRESVAGRLMSFSIGYESAHAAFDESSEAEDTARLLSTEHHTERVTAEDFARSIDSIVAATDLPSHDGVNTYFASRLAAGYVKVAMTGIGGDELFGGYSTFRYERAVRSALAAPVTLVSRALAPLLRPLIAMSEDAGMTQWPLLWLEQSALGNDDPFFRWFQVRRLSSPYAVEQLLRTGSAGAQALAESAWSARRPEFARVFGLSDELSRRTQALELGGYLSPVLLRDADAMSMFHALELRVPFLDSAFARRGLAFGISELADGDGSKAPLRRALAGHVPSRVLRRRKQGFGVPLGAWLRHPAVQREIISRFHEPSATATAVFDREELKRLVESFYHGIGSERPFRLVARLWTTYMLLRWLERAALAA